MSPRASKCAWFENEISGATYTVMLAIADVVNDPNDNLFFMSMTTLAETANIKRQTASRAVAKLVELRWLEIVEDHRSDAAGKPSVYRFTFKNEPEMLRSKLSPGVPDLVAPSENGVHDPSSEVPDLVAGVPDPSSRGAMRSGTNSIELNRTKTTPPSKTVCSEKACPAENDEGGNYKKSTEELIEKALNLAADQLTEQFRKHPGHGFRKALWPQIEALRPDAEHFYTNARFHDDRRLDCETIARYVRCKHRGEPFTTPVVWSEPSPTKELAR